MKQLKTLALLALTSASLLAQTPSTTILDNIELGKTNYWVYCIKLWWKDCINADHLWDDFFGDTTTVRGYCIGLPEFDAVSFVRGYVDDEWRSWNLDQVILRYGAFYPDRWYDPEAIQPRPRFEQLKKLLTDKYGVPTSEETDKNYITQIWELPSMTIENTYHFPRKRMAELENRRGILSSPSDLEEPYSDSGTLTYTSHEWLKQRKLYSEKLRQEQAENPPQPPEERLKDKL